MGCGASTSHEVDDDLSLLIVPCEIKPRKKDSVLHVSIYNRGYISEEMVLNAIDRKTPAQREREILKWIDCQNPSTVNAAGDIGNPHTQHREALAALDRVFQEKEKGLFEEPSMPMTPKNPFKSWNMKRTVQRRRVGKAVHRSSE